MPQGRPSAFVTAIAFDAIVGDRSKPTRRFQDTGRGAASMVIAPRQRTDFLDGGFGWLPPINAVQGKALPSGDAGGVSDVA
jgi:hypothetical protein